MMDVTYTLAESEKYIKKHTFQKMWRINVYCCQYELYENTTNWFHQFIFYCCKPYDNQGS